jgi:hypothetical protein
VLILQYLKVMRRSSPELALRARHLVGLGYQRLVTFEVKGGGFSLFGGAPADVALTAYGLHEFVDMAEVYPVDPGLVPRTRRFLLSAQQGDGSFAPRPSYFFHDEPSRADRVRVTAYAAWALIRAGEQGAAITRALAYVKTNLAASPDAYTGAIVASLLVAKERAHPWLADVLRRLPAPTPHGARAAFWSLGTGATITHSAGRPGDVETTALLAAALLRSGRLPFQSRQALAYLVGAKAPRGGWGSTQANVLALQALLAGQRAAAQAAVQGQVEVLLDDQVVGQASLTEAGAGVVHAIDASARLRAGQTQQLTVRWRGKGVPLVQVVGSYHLPDDRAPRPRPATSRLDLSVSYDRKELRTRDTVTVRARLANRTTETAVMPMIDLGKPAGFDPVTEDLEQLVKQGRIAQFEVHARQIVLYLAQLRGKASVELSFRLRARFPLRVTAPASSAYEYYHEAARAESGPAILTVR